MLILLLGSVNTVTAFCELVSHNNFINVTKCKYWQYLTIQWHIGLREQAKTQRVATSPSTWRPLCARQSAAVYAVSHLQWGIYRMCLGILVALGAPGQVLAGEKLNQKDSIDGWSCTYSSKGDKQIEESKNMTRRPHKQVAVARPRR